MKHIIKKSALSFVVWIVTGPLLDTVLPGPLPLFRKVLFAVKCSRPIHLWVYAEKKELGLIPRILCTLVPWIDEDVEECDWKAISYAIFWLVFKRQ